MAVMEASRREAILASIRVEERGDDILVYPLHDNNSDCIVIRKPWRDSETGHIGFSLITVRDRGWHTYEAECLALALEKAAELARELDAKFMDEMGLSLR